VESTPGTENERGTGFGLKLCYELVRLNNGTITVESNEGEGTCFTIVLPE
jgi:signal transduction histidine kinase